MTKEQAEQMVQNYCEYYSLAEKYYIETTKSTWANIRLDESGNIQHEVNTACGCHPEYEWQVWAYSSDFVDWISKQ
jgi:hypothetical protein